MPHNNEEPQRSVEELTYFYDFTSKLEEQYA